MRPDVFITMKFNYDTETWMQLGSNVGGPYLGTIDDCQAKGYRIVDTKQFGDERSAYVLFHLRKIPRNVEVAERLMEDPRD